MVAEVELVQAVAPVPQAEQVVPLVKNPLVKQFAVHAAVELKHNAQTLLLSAYPVEHEVETGALQVATPTVHAIHAVPAALATNEVLQVVTAVVEVQVKALSGHLTQVELTNEYP